MASRFRWTLTKRAVPFAYPETTEVLTKDPIGWDNMTLRLVRDKLYHGVFTEFTLSLKWHCNGGGKEYIDNIYNLEDVNAVIDVLIEIDCDSSGTYEELYTGRLNLASYTNDGEYTTCNIEKSDLFTKLKSRDEISVNLESDKSIGNKDITTVGIKNLPMHSMDIRYDNEWRIREGYGYTTDLGFDTGSEEANGAFITHDMGIVSADVENFSLPWTEQVDITTAGSTNWEDHNIQPLVTFDDDGIDYPILVDWEIDFNGVFTDTFIDGTARTNSLFGLVLRWGVKDPLLMGTFQGITLFEENGYDTDPTETIPFSIQNSGTMTIYKGDSIWLDWLILENYNIGGQRVRLAWTYGDSFFKFNTVTKYEETNAESILIHEAFNMVCDSMADEDLKFYSDFYGRTDSEKIVYAEDGCGSHIAITNGLNIREFENKSIFCSLRELFTSANALHNIGLTIETVDAIYAEPFEAIRVEPIPYFYDKDSQILLLDRPVKVEVINDNSRYINHINIGYDKWESEFKGGLDEPCTKHEYNTEVNAIKGEYNKLSKYLASSYAIERTRRKNRFPTEDWKFDNDNFFIAVKSESEFDVIFIEGNSILIDTSNIIFGGVVAGDTMSVNSPLNSYIFTVQSVYILDLGDTPTTYVIKVDAPDVVVLEPTVSCTVGNSTQGWSRDGFVNFIPDGGGGIIFDSVLTSIQASDVLEVSNTASNNGTKNVLLNDTIKYQINQSNTLVVISEPAVTETANNAIIGLNGSFFYSPEICRDAFKTIGTPTGMIAALSAYNLRLTPARMLLPHMKSIGACLTKIHGKAYFIRGDGNTELETEMDLMITATCPDSYEGIAVKENMSFAHNDSFALSEPLWIPEIYKFSYPLTAAQLASVRANPHGYIEVTDDHGNVRKGFILDVEYTLKTGLTKFELLKMYEV